MGRRQGRRDDAIRPGPRELNRAGSFGLVGTLAVLGALLCLEYGRRGFMPLDHSITFDGGWRILSGQVPYRDFSTPSGVVPILMQGALFAALGVSWFAYCLHAALVNAAFAVLTYGILREAGGARWLAGTFGAFAAVLFYPGVGVPSHDHHAFAFGLLAAYLVLRGARSGAPFAWWSASGAALVLGLLCKQVPTAFVAPLVAMVGVAKAGDRRATFLAAFGSGAVAAGAAVGLVGWIAGAEFDLVREALFEVPRQVGAARFADVPWVRLVLAAARAFPTFAIAPLAFVLAALGTVGRGARTITGLAAGLVVATVLYAGVTNNQPAFGLGYLPAALGLTAIAATRIGSRRVAAAGLAAFVALGAYEAVRFHVAWTIPRRLNDFRRAPATEDGSGIAPALSFLRFAMPEATEDPAYGRYRASHFRDVVTFFDTHPDNFFLLGDASILYGLTGRPSANPVLWFHPGLTLPEPGTVAWERYEDRLLERLAALDVRYVVVEHKGTWMGTSLADFPKLQTRLPTGKDGVAVFGPFYVVPLTR